MANTATRILPWFFCRFAFSCSNTDIEDKCSYPGN
jgi:hypothetical protein